VGRLKWEVGEGGVKEQEKRERASFLSNKG